MESSLFYKLHKDGRLIVWGKPSQASASVRFIPGTIMTSKQLEWPASPLLLLFEGNFNVTGWPVGYGWCTYLMKVWQSTLKSLWLTFQQELCARTTSIEKNQRVPLQRHSDRGYLYILHISISIHIISSHVMLE